MSDQVRSSFRAGDVVKHRPSGEEWVLSCDEERGEVLPAGWPESVGKADDCDLVTQASDTTRMDTWRHVSCIDGYRGAIARKQLEAIKRATGLIGKFWVHRVDGKDRPGAKHHGCDYFVLDLTHDPHALPAIRAYAESCRVDYPVLAEDLDKKAGQNSGKSGLFDRSLAKNLQTIADANGYEVGSDVSETAARLIQQMEKLTQQDRLGVFMMLDDFYCRRCGVDQPPGDCQCGGGVR
jgi:hypothetical protein